MHAQTLNDLIVSGFYQKINVMLISVQSAILQLIVDLYLECTVSALPAIMPDVLFWPGPEERKEISARIKNTWVFPKAVIIKDGTHLGLLMSPINQPDHFS